MQYSRNQISYFVFNNFWIIIDNLHTRWNLLFICFICSTHFVFLRQLSILAFMILMERDVCSQQQGMVMFLQLDYQRTWLKVGGKDNSLLTDIVSLSRLYYKGLSAYSLVPRLTSTGRLGGKGWCIGHWFLDKSKLMHFHKFYVMCGTVLMTIFKRKQDQWKNSLQSRHILQCDWFGRSNWLMVGASWQTIPRERLTCQNREGEGTK